MGPYRVFVQRATDDTARMVDETQNRRDAHRSVAINYVVARMSDSEPRTFALDRDGLVVAEVW